MQAPTVVRKFTDSLEAMVEGINTKLLALSVVMQALQDIVRPTACHESQRRKAKKTAGEFLFADERADDLKMWCDLAGLQFEALRSRASHIRDNNIDLALVQQEQERQLRAEADDDLEVLH